MKKVMTILGAIMIASFMMTSCGKSDTVVIDNIEVKTKDLDKMNWAEATEACEKMGEGYRLPTKDELNILYENKDDIGGFTTEKVGFYWSSTEGDDDETDAWVQEFRDGFQNDGGKHYNYRSRPVRSIEE